MKVGIISSHLEDRQAHSEIGYEASQLQKFFQSRDHSVALIDPKRTTCGVNDRGCFARFTCIDEGTISVTDLDVIIVRRTKGMVDEILDFLKFATKTNQTLYIVDSIESMGRPTSKVEAISKRAESVPQPPTQILRHLKDLEENFDFPLISKPMFGNKGMGVVLCENHEALELELKKNYETYSGYSTIVQSDVTGTAEYRVVVVNGNALGCVSKPAPEKGFARNADFVEEFSNYTGSNRMKIM